MSSASNSFSFDPNEYVRPNENWVCGGACDGLPCSRGPTSNGECGAPCNPVQIGDRFYCNNAASLTGKCDDGPLPDGRCCHDPPQCEPTKAVVGYVCRWGACADGPLPNGSCSRKFQVCKPRRTIKSQRQLVTATVFGCSVGLALLFLGGPVRHLTTSPGDVASVHSAIADNCSACHQAGELDVTSTLKLATTKHDATWQNGLCLKCHQDYSEFDWSPHTMPTEQLAATEAALATATSSGRFDVMAARSMLHVPTELACASCHREHHGTMHDLTKLSDQQCQMCHKNSFHSFASGHPPFTDYPLIRRSEIYFDHSSHYGIHFANYARTAPEGIPPGGEEEIAAASSSTCAACHETDISGAYVVTLGYEKMCASCHGRQVWDDRVPAMSTLALPFSKDRDGLRPNTVQVTPGPFDLPPIMQLLLAADPRFVEAYPAIRRVSWQSSREVLEDEASAITQLSAAMADLITALREDAQGAIAARLTAVCGDRLGEKKVERLARVTATADFVSSVDQMFSQLSGDSESAPASMRTESEPVMGTGAGRPVTGWHFDASFGVVDYRPREHSDSLIREWTDAAAALVTSDALLVPDGGESGGARDEAVRDVADRLPLAAAQSATPSTASTTACK